MITEGNVSSLFHRPDYGNTYFQAYLSMTRQRFPFNYKYGLLPRIADFNIGRMDVRARYAITYRDDYADFVYFSIECH